MFSVLKAAWARWSALVGFGGSQEYWRQRYRRGGDSGSGSGGKAAKYKADVVNKFVRDHGIETVIEFGCGDGRQLEQAFYPAYLGVDISSHAVESCMSRFAADPSKRFVTLDQYRGEQAELALSLDVVFHLVEDDVYQTYLRRLFTAATRYVVICSTDQELEPIGGMRHVRHREVSRDAAIFTEFVRMTEIEDGLPPPVEFNRGLPTKFLLYRRLD